MNGFLSENQRKYGQKRYILFGIFNGLSVSLLAEGTLILYALKFGVPDYLVGVMSSFIFLGMSFIFLGKELTIRIGVTKTVAAAWFFRNISILVAVSAPIVFYYSSSFYLGVTFVMLGSFCFYAFRGVGVIGWTPILGEITTDDDRGKFSSVIFLCFNVAYFLGILSLVILFEFWDTIRAFQTILVLGCILGCFSAYNVFLVPESETPKTSASVSLKDAVRYILKSPRGFKLVWVQTIYFIGVTLTVPYSMLALKEGYGVKDDSAMLFILVQLTGAIVTSLIAKRVIDKTGPRKILIALFLLMITASFMWTIAPANFYWWYCGIIFFIIGSAQMGGNLALVVYFLAIIPPLKRIGSTLVITVVSSILAGISGSVIGAGMLKILGNYHFESLALYHVFFLIVALLLLCGIFIINSLEKVRIFKIAKNVNSMLYAFIRIKR